MQFVGCLSLRVQLFDGIPDIVHIANAIRQGELREDRGLEITDVHRRLPLLRDELSSSASMVRRRRLKRLCALGAPRSARAVLLSVG